MIGIERYREGLPVATGAANDARRFRDYAEHALGLTPNRIHLLIDADATKSSMETEISEWLPRNTSQSSEVFLYFAGHGTPSADPRKPRRFLVPWDAKAATMASQGVDIETVLANLTKLPAKRVVVMLDACFTGTGDRSVITPGARSLVWGNAPIVKKQVTPGRLLVLSAAGPDETAGVTSNQTGGLFSDALFRGLDGEADTNGDGDVAWPELGNFVIATVDQEARSTSRSQTPVVEGIGEVDGIVVHPTGKHATTDQRLQPVASGTASVAKNDGFAVRLTEDFAGFSLKQAATSGWVEKCVGPCQASVAGDQPLVISKDDDNYDLGAPLNAGAKGPLKVTSTHAYWAWGLAGGGAALGILGAALGAVWSGSEGKELRPLAFAFIGVGSAVAVSGPIIYFAIGKKVSLSIDGQP